VRNPESILADGPKQAKKGAYLRWVLGCLGAALAVLLAIVVAVALLPGSKARLVRSGIKPGMSVAEVVTHARGWLTCRASADPVNDPAIELQVWPTSFGSPWDEAQRHFSDPSEMADALAAEMKLGGREWKMTFGYITMIPRRIFFDVTFSSEGRVIRVSEVRWSKLD
jgi:hypothetical protein